MDVLSHRVSGFLSHWGDGHKERQNTRACSARWLPNASQDWLPAEHLGSLLKSKYLALHQPSWIRSFRMCVFVPWAILISSVQPLSHVQLFATLWTAARQASLSTTNSWSIPKLTCIESVMPSNHLILCCPLLLSPWKHQFTQNELFLFV